MKKTVFPLALSALACAAQAATVTVNDTTDGSSDIVCTLRDAVASITASSNQGGCVADTATGDYGTSDTIEFDPSLAGETVGVVVTNGITISKELIIKGLLDSDGKPKITLDGNDSNRIFNVTGGTSLSITGVRFFDGNAGSGTTSGGAIYVGSFNNNPQNHILTLEQCEFDSNAAGYGGAIRHSGRSGAIHINQSTFSNNSAGYNGGAVASNDTSTVSISNSTFSNNSATNNGGAIWADGAANISNSTFSNNSANSYSGGAVHADSLNARHLTLLDNTAVNGSGQALYVSNSSSTLYNSIIIGNNSSAQCVAGSTLTGSHNLEGWAASSSNPLVDTTTCGNVFVSANGVSQNDIFATTIPVDNGGPTETLALLSSTQPTTNPAIGVADADTSKMLDSTGNWTDATLDQRGYGRLPENSASSRSIGAFEFNGLGFTPEDLPYGQVGVDYEPTEPVGIVSGGTPAYEYAVVAPTQLPAGLTLNANTGVLSGTPTVAETVFFDVTVSDSEGRSVTKSLSLTISPRALPGEPGDAAPIPALPAPLLPLLAALMGTAAFVRQRRR